MIEMIYDESLDHKEIKRKLTFLGWKDGNQAFNIHEHSKIEDYILWKILFDKIKKINPIFINLTEEEEKEVLENLKNMINEADEVRMLNYLKYGITLPIKDRSETIKLIDHENIDNNSFFFLHEAKFSGFPQDIKPDFTLFINGIPIAVIEVKSSSIIGSHNEALRQIDRYETYSPKLFNYVQFGVAYGDKKLYTPTMPREIGSERRLPAFSWKVSEKENIFDLLRPERLLEILRYFTFYVRLQERGAKRGKIIARYNQYRAVKRIMDRIDKYLNGKDYKNQGLIWHWQGSGKTYIMFFTAYYFLDKYIEREPVVFFIVDRLQLQSQHFDVLKAVEDERFKTKLKLIESINDLKETVKTIIKGIESKSIIPTGVYLTMIHKFRRDEFKDLIESIDKNEVLFLIDEAHRSQYGDLAATMRAVFPKAMYFGFTGTPIFKSTKNTFKHFAYPNDPEKKEFYLDVYFIRESIEDGFTKPIRYVIAREKGIEESLNEEDLKAIIEAYANIDPDEIEEFFQGKRRDLRGLREEIKKRLRKTKVILESDKWIKQFSEYIAERIEEDTENFKFKTMVVAVNRLACVKYKKYLDEALSRRFGEEAKNWAQVVMTYEQNDLPDIEKFKAEIKGKYRLSPSEANKKFQEDFVEKEDPRILIVTDMLLTGFDAPVLKVMYLDKPLYEHRLLQAIARVNRPYMDKKFGLIVDSIGLIEYLAKIVHIYNLLAEKDERIAKDLEMNCVRSIDEEAEDFKQNLERIKQELKSYGIVDVDKILQLKGKDEELKTAWDEVKNKIGELALKYKAGDPDAIRLVNDLTDLVRQYKSLGPHPYRVKFYDEMKIIARGIYGGLLKLLNVRRRKSKFCDDLMRYIWDNIEVDEFEVIGEFEVEKVKIDAKSRLFEVSARFYAIYNKAEENADIPIYRLILERVRRLLHEWALGKLKLMEFINGLKKIEGDLENLEKSVRGRSEEDMIVESLRYYLKEFNYPVNDLKNFREALRREMGRVKKVGDVLPTTINELSTAFLVDLLEIAKDPKMVARQVSQIIEEFVKPMLKRLCQE